MFLKVWVHHEFNEGRSQIINLTVTYQFLECILFTVNSGSIIDHLRAKLTIFKPEYLQNVSSSARSLVGTGVPLIQRHDVVSTVHRLHVGFVYPLRWNILNITFSPVFVHIYPLTTFFSFVHEYVMRIKCWSYFWRDFRCSYHRTASKTC